MKKFIKDSEDNIKSIDTVNGFIPEGYTLVADEDISDAELTIARRKKIDQVRSNRDNMMIVHDKKYMIALKDATDTTAMLADRTVLLDLPAAAQAAVDALETKEDIEAHDAFDGLSLSETYE